MRDRELDHWEGKERLSGRMVKREKRGRSSEITFKNPNIKEKHNRRGGRKLEEDRRRKEGQVELDTEN